MGEKRLKYPCPKCDGEMEYHHQNNETISLYCSNCNHMVLVRKMPIDFSIKPTIDLSIKPIEIERKNAESLLSLLIYDEKEGVLKR